MERVLVAIRAALYMTGFVLFWGWLALLVRRFDPSVAGQLPGWLHRLGLLLMVLGGSLALACVAAFVIRGGGTPAPFDAPRHFVAVGPYRWTRNPMYVGGLTVLLGFALWLRSPAVVLLTVAAWGLVHLFVVIYEEPTLRRMFGATYDDYCGRVSRWVPRPPDRG